jgi:tol-pal system protein YbgF
LSLLTDSNFARNSVWLVPPRRLMMRALAIVGLCTIAAGCSGARVDVLETEVSRQREEMSELRRNQAAQRVQFDEFRNRLLVLQDKLESERIVANRQASNGGGSEMMPSLPRVVLPAPEPRTMLPVQHAETAPRSVVIGPDGVPHVASDDAPAAESQRGSSGRRSRPAGPSDGSTAPPQDGNTPEEAAASSYQAAKAQLDAGQLEVSRKMFEVFLAAHPDHTLADNALYWIGETWYAKALWIKAAGIFSAVVKRYPRGNKIPDAMLKTGLCYVHLGEHSDANEVFGHLMRQYPGTPAAEIAREQRGRIEAKR